MVGEGEARALRVIVVGVELWVVRGSSGGVGVVVVGWGR